MHSEHGRSWDEMFAVCKHNAENGLPNDTYQTSWMSEQRRRKEKLDSIGFAWNDTGISEQAQGNENTNQVGPMAAMFTIGPMSCIQYPAFDLCSRSFACVLDCRSGRLGSCFLGPRVTIDQFFGQQWGRASGTWLVDVSVFESTL
jgi:hypothetical protein